MGEDDEVVVPVKVLEPAPDTLRALVPSATCGGLAAGRVTLDAVLSGPLLNLRLEQEFTNPADTQRRAFYSCPLPKDAVVHRAQVHRRGRSAPLPVTVGAFKTELTWFEPRETLRIELELACRLPWSERGLEFELPRSCRTSFTLLVEGSGWDVEAHLPLERQGPLVRWEGRAPQTVRLLPRPTDRPRPLLFTRNGRCVLVIEPPVPERTPLHRARSARRPCAASRLTQTRVVDCGLDASWDEPLSELQPERPVLVHGTHCGKGLLEVDGLWSGARWCALLEPLASQNPALEVLAPRVEPTLAPEEQIREALDNLGWAVGSLSVGLSSREEVRERLSDVLVLLEARRGHPRPGLADLLRDGRAFERQLVEGRPVALPRLERYMRDLRGLPRECNCPKCR